jgi:hypothetical protein
LQLLNFKASAEAGKRPWLVVYANRRPPFFASQAGRLGPSATEPKVRFWCQSHVDYENGKTYWDRLREHLEAANNVAVITGGSTGIARQPMHTKQFRQTLKVCSVNISRV